VGTFLTSLAESCTSVQYFSSVRLTEFHWCERDGLDGLEKRKMSHPGIRSPDLPPHSLVAIRAATVLLDVRMNFLSHNDRSFGIQKFRHFLFNYPV